VMPYQTDQLFRAEGTRIEAGRRAAEIRAAAGAPELLAALGRFPALALKRLRYVILPA
jgi:hypothetical protein